MSGLTDLLRALGSDAALEKEFHENPEAVLGRFEIDEKTRQALMAGDVSLLSKLAGLKDVSLSHGTIKSYS